jgi:hypothetical protein
MKKLGVLAWVSTFHHQAQRLTYTTYLTNRIQTQPTPPDLHARPPLHAVRHRHHHHQGLRGLLLGGRGRKGGRDGRTGEEDYTLFWFSPTLPPAAHLLPPFPSPNIPPIPPNQTLPQPQPPLKQKQVLQYQAQCRKLPKALRDWQAYVDCRDTIDNFLELLPLFQALAHQAMRERHWRAVMAITGKELVLTEDVFKLQHLLECGLLAHRDEVEEVANSAVKEEQIEVKLAAIESDWAALNLVRLRGSDHCLTRASTALEEPNTTTNL